MIMNYTDRNGKEIKSGDLLLFRSGYIGQLVEENKEWYLKLAEKNSPKMNAKYATIGNCFSSAEIIQLEKEN